MPQDNTRSNEKTRSRIKEPGKYNVVFINDDFTPMEFVTLVLKHIFYKSDIDAEHLMLKVHREGKAIVGTYSYDIAMSKSTEAMNVARSQGYPLKITVTIA